MRIRQSTCRELRATRPVRGVDHRTHIYVPLWIEIYATGCETCTDRVYRRSTRADRARLHRAIARHHLPTI